jgi:hypothetical protein
MHYNYCRVHSTLRVAPSMEVGFDVEREADLIDIEPQRSLDITHRQRDHFD